jgi:hypothetical protein
MKKGFLFIIGVVIIAISGLSELALSVQKKEQWSNYVQSWDIQLKGHRHISVLKKGYVMQKPDMTTRETRQKTKN